MISRLHTWVQDQDHTHSAYSGHGYFAPNDNTGTGQDLNDQHRSARRSTAYGHEVSLQQALFTTVDEDIQAIELAFSRSTLYSNGDSTGTLPSDPTISIANHLEQEQLRPTLQPLAVNFTTLHVRNIPARYTQEMLLQEWSHHEGLNMLWLPYSRRLRRGMGYAFVNFGSHDCARQFQRDVHKTRALLSGRDSKDLNVVAATWQGLEMTLRQFRETNLSKAEAAGVHSFPILLDAQGHRLNTVAELIRMGILQHGALS
eukprot:TRINITY_DN9441_c0_g7_i1.p1 TRINITY_DN9441_c0_g7~~TRINITY_DN9441_c0_g7_i1.p1  ORF type:complete len:258 (-),score=25.91 TRINITY_DN9441_c0_g7_i1:87-860(-)